MSVPVNARCLCQNVPAVLTETGSKLIELTGLRLRDSMRAGDASRRIQIHWHAQMHAHPILAQLRLKLSHQELMDFIDSLVQDGASDFGGEMLTETSVGSDS